MTRPRKTAPEIPEEVLREAWLAGTREVRAAFPPDHPERKGWKIPEAMWAERPDVFSRALLSAVAVIDRWRKGGA